MNQPKTPKAQRVAREGTLIGIVCGVPFYEHPTLGEDAPLFYLTKDGRVKVSDFYELPTLDELPTDALY